MASFESKVSDIFSENLRLSKKIPVLIRQLFHESESDFKRRMRRATQDRAEFSYMKLFDILYIDFYFNEIGDRFLNWVIKNYSQRFTELELSEMLAQATSHLDFYEIQRVIPGRGSFIKSLYTQEEGFLEDVSSSTNLVKWDIILARLYPIGGNYRATGSLAVFYQDEKNFILSQLEEYFSEHKRRSGNSEYDVFAKNNWHLFFQIETEIERKARNKKYYTNYGELQLCEVRFTVQNLEMILERINFLEEFDFIEKKTRKDKKKKRTITRYQFDWLSSGIEDKLEIIKTRDVKDGFIFSTSRVDTEGNRLGKEVIGNFFIDKYLGRLETRSLELAEFAARYFLSLFDHAIIFKRIIKKKIDVNQQNHEKMVAEESGDSEVFDPELTRKVGENCILNLLDQKIPALNHLSPREARGNPETIPLLIEWLKGFENMLEHQKKRGDQFASIDQIKKELDIDW